MSVSSRTRDHAATMFATDTADHRLTILHDEGIYRHLLCKTPGTSMYWFTITTTPQTLIIDGDMGTYVFRREHDMFTWFRGFSPDYWAQKLEAVDKNGGVKEHDEDLFREWVVQDFWERRDQYEPEDARRIWDGIKGHLLSRYTDRGSREACIDLLNDFAPRSAADGAPIDFTYEDAWDHDWTDYSIHYLFSCHAILWAINEYRKATTP